MAIFLDTTGNTTLGIGTCARCWRKFPIGELLSDPNSPGLKVCIDDLDDFDPYRLPARVTEDITLPFYRPDEGLTAGGPIPSVNALFGVRSTESPFGLRVTIDGNLRVTVFEDEDTF